MTEQEIPEEPTEDVRNDPVPVHPDDPQPREDDPNEASEPTEEEQ